MTLNPPRDTWRSEARERLEYARRLRNARYFADLDSHPTESSSPRRVLQICNALQNSFQEDRCPTTKFSPRDTRISFYDSRCPSVRIIIWRRTGSRVKSHSEDETRNMRHPCTSRDKLLELMSESILWTDRSECSKQANEFCIPVHVEVSEGTVLDFRHLVNTLNDPSLGTTR